MRCYKAFTTLKKNATLFVSVGSWECHGKTGAHLPGEPGPDGPRLRSRAGPLLQGGAHPEHGPRGQGDHHGGAADQQASQETGLHASESGCHFEILLVCVVFREELIYTC